MVILVDDFWPTGPKVVLGGSWKSLLNFGPSGAEVSGNSFVPTGRKYFTLRQTTFATKFDKQKSI